MAFCLAAPLGSHAQTKSEKDRVWQARELWRAKGLFSQNDLSPIEEAFAKKEADLLLSYYSLAKSRQFGNPRASTPEEIAKAQMGQEEKNALNQEIRERTLARLLALPGLARLLGNRIEESAVTKGLDLHRHHWLSTLADLGSEESIVELGRFIFDDRDPDYTPPLDSEPGYPGGSFRAIQYSATSALNGALRGKHAIVDEIKDKKKYGRNPDWFKMIHHWWLHSEEAAPYRRKLADAGVVLPPGYPPMKELQGARTTIAPAMAKPQQAEQTPPSVNRDRAPAPVPPPAAVTVEDPVKPWVLVVALVAGILISVLMAVRRGLIGKQSSK
jgi:hypothetical protein